ncbi:MAG: aromatic ring-hydroxylating dioxygenase subunit alpha [Gammaproteobacteria bacterium]|nr:aromatic ring-hydroxylating dioxygenase subunit alpha [Gammaproteobacteria bacterium]
MSVTGLDVLPPAAKAAPARDLRRTGIHPDYWYPLLRAKKLKQGKAIGVTFAGEPIVLVRTVAGRAFALEDRCAHRQVPLSAGVVNGEQIQCCYHGWTYDCTGRCVNIPYIGRNEIAPRGVRGYPCREEYGLIWLFPGDAAQADNAHFPEVPAWRDPAYKTRYLDHEVDCHYSFLHENLMDMNHQFLHRRIMAQIRTGFLDLREGDDWVEVDYTFSRVGRQPVGEKFMLGLRPEATSERPRDLMTVRTGYPHQTLKFWTAGSAHPALDLWITYVPVDAVQRRNHTFALMSIRRPGIPGLMEVLWPFIVWFTNGIFAEDKYVVEMEQAAFNRQGADWNQEIFPVVQRTRELLRRKGVDIPAK